MAGVYNIWGSDNYLVLKYKGTADMDELYKTCMDWFKKQKMEYHENFCKAKHPTPVGQEMFWRWHIFRNINEYLRFKGDIHWHFWDWEPVEVMVGGKKKTLHKGRLQVIIKGDLVTDYGNRYEKSAFHHALREFMDKYVLLVKLHMWSSFFEYLMQELYNLIKEKLSMKLYQNAYQGDR